MNTSSNKAYLYLVKLISGRDYSEFNLREKLYSKKFSADEIDSAINDIKTRGFLREESYSESRIKTFMDKGYSPKYIDSRLKEEHLEVSNELILAVFTEHCVSREDQIRRMILKKLTANTKPDYSEQNKILRYLLSKGHDFNDSKKVMALIIGELAPQIDCCVDFSID